jgi:hypothetical protein
MANNRKLKLNKGIQFPNGQNQATDQGSTQWFDTIADFEAGFRLIDFDPDLEYAIQETGLGYRLKKNYRNDTAGGLNTIITLANVNTYFDLTRSSEAGAGAVASVNGQTGAVTLNAANIPVTPTATQTGTTGQTAINNLDTRLIAQETRSTTTRKGNLPTGGAKVTPVVINAASMPLSIADGDYYVVTTVNSATANYYDLTAIGYGVVNAGVGAKISFNATQNEYIYQAAGENQTESELPTVAAVATTTAIATTSTNQGGLNTEFRTAIKNATENLGVFVPSKQYLAGNVIVQGGKIYQANANFTAGATFVASDWTQLAGTLDTPYNFGAINGNVTILGDDLATAETIQTAITIFNVGTFEIISGTFPATATTLKIKSTTTDYITIVVPANATVGTAPTSITINNASIVGSIVTPIKIFQSSSAASFNTAQWRYTPTILL